jgi:dihydrofolate reductase
MQNVIGESMSKPFDLVLGRKTYEIFAAHWPHTDDPGAEPLNKATSTWRRRRRVLSFEN